MAQRSRPVIIFFSLVALVILLAGTSFYFYRRSQRLSRNPSLEETKALIARVDAIAVLPQNEAPTVATVTDPAKLRSQAFFVDAKQGYKVLIYTNAKKAVLFDPESGKIVNIAPINIDTNAPGTSTEAPAL